MAFEVLDLGRQGRAPNGAPRVGVTARGLISFNAGALELIGNPEYMEILYDAERQLVGARGSTSVSNSRKVLMNSTGMGMVSAARLVRAIGLTPTKNSTIPAKLEGDILVFKPRFVSQDVLAHSGLNSD